MKQKRAILFIDGSNFVRGMKRENLLPIKNYKSLSESLTRKKGHQWLETRFYVGKIKQDKTQKSQELYKNQRAFLQNLQNQDRRISYFLGRFNKNPAKGAALMLAEWIKNLPNNPNAANIPPVVVEELKKIAQKGKYQWQEKMVDVMIATDMATMALKGNFEVAYLLSADGDYAPAVKQVLAAGCEVFIASAERNNASALAQSANNKFIALDADFFAELKEA